MLRQLRTPAVLAYRTCPNLARNAIFSRRLINTEAKYAEKLRQAAERYARVTARVFPLVVMVAHTIV